MKFDESLLFNFDQSIVEALIYESSLTEYIKAFWHIVEPGSEYLHNWHIEAIAEHLEAVTNGQIRNLVINMPPRCAKSLIVSVFWPTWVWTFKPESRWIFSSYVQSLTTRDSVKCRRIIESPLYQKLWSDVYQITGDQNTKMRFENNRTGYRIATSVDGAATGEGGDFIVSDDPQSAGEAHSLAKVEATIDWWDNVMSTRGNNPKTVAKVIVMQRLSDTDLSAHVLEQGGYDHLLLPMEFDKTRKCKTSIGWEDPRQEDGELLWPERFDPETLKDFKTRLGSLGYAGQMQQAPVAAGGNIIKKEWIRTYRELPADAKIYSWSWDTAIKVGQENDFSVGILLTECHNGYYIIDLYKQKLEYPELKKMVNALYNKHKTSEVLIEDKASGQQILQDFKRDSNIPVIAMMPGKDMPLNKVERMHLISPQFEAGKVYFPENAEWLADAIYELTTFPNGKHDDICDALTQYIARRLSTKSNAPRIRVL